MPDSKITVVPLTGLTPNWSSYKSDVPGFQRWAISWVGGPEGYLHLSRKNAAVSTECQAGLMVFPVATAGAALHTHEFDEVYVIHRGKMALIHEDRSETLMGPLDAAYMPAGVAHSIRNVGDEDAYLMFFQTAIEREGFQLGDAENQGGSRWIEE